MVKFASLVSLLVTAAVGSTTSTWAFVPSTTLTGISAPGRVVTTATPNNNNHYNIRPTFLAAAATDEENLADVALLKLVGNKRFKAIKKKAKNTTLSSTLSTIPVVDTLKIIIAGAPASGKGTQCEIIQQKFGLVHLSTGDMLRAAVAAKSPVGKAAKSFMDGGKLVPDDVIIGVVKDRLALPDCKNRGWLLDGFPRTKAQADALASAGVSADCFLFLNVPDEDIVARVVGRRTDPDTGKIYHLTFSPPPADDEDLMKRLVHRSDDTEEKIKVRLEQFHTNVASVKDCYTEISADIDGTGKPDEVAAAISKALKEKCGDKVEV